MSGVASYKTVIKKTGAITAMTSEAMSTNSTLANTYQIGSTAKRVWDRDTALTFYEASTATTSGRVAIASSDVSLTDYLFGRVTFGSTQAEPITVSASYLPLATVAGANSYTLNQSRDLLEDTDFSSTGWKSRKAALKDVSLTIGRFDSIDLDFHSLINSGVSVVAEVRPGGVGVAARGFFKVESEGRSGDVSALEASDLSFQLDASTLGDFSWDTP